MAVGKKQTLSLEELLEQALAKDEDQPHEVSSNWIWTYFKNVVINRDSERIPLSISQRTHMEKIYDYYGASGIIDKVENYIFDKKLMLIGEDGANLVTRSKPIAFFAEGKYWVNNHAHVLDNNRCILLEYLCFYINSIDLIPYITGSAQPKMTQEKMNSILTPLPPLAEQQRIVDRVESLFDKLDKAKELVQNALDSFENRKAAILHKAFTGELTAKWRKENTVILSEWEEKKFKDFCLLKRGYDLPANQRISGEFPLVSSSGVIDTHDEKKVNGPGVVTGRSGTIGRVHYIEKDFWPLNTTLYGMNLFNNIPKYVYYYLSVFDFKSYSSSTAVPTLNRNLFADVLVKVPPVEEQKEIVRILDNILEKEQQAKELCDVLDKIDLMKKAILTKAFRGELGTNDPTEDSVIELLKEVLMQRK